MKKITFMAIIALLWSFNSNAQYLTEDFEGGTVPPAGWTSFIGTNGLGTAQNWTTSATGNGGSTTAAFNRYENVTGGIAEDWLVTSQIDLSTATSAELRFFTRQAFTSEYGSIFEIRVSTASQTTPADFATVESYTESTLNGNTTAYVEKIVDLSAYDGMMIYIAFVHLNDDGDSWYVDDVTVDDAPACPTPSALTVTPVSTDSANIAWTENGSATVWDIELVDVTAAGTATGTPTTTGVTNPYLLSGLTAENDYEIYVRADCAASGGSGVSAWFGPVAFTTPAACEVISAAQIDALTDISIDFSWTGPLTGTPVGYNWEIVAAGTGQGGTVLASGSTAGTTASSGDVLTLDTDYDIWIQTDCGVDGTSIWLGPLGFTTQPGPAPINDDCGGATVVTQETSIVDAASATPTAGTIVGATDSGLAAEACNGFTGVANDDVWYAFEALTANVNITFEITGFDGVAILYSGTCGALVVEDCADNSVLTAPIVEEINATGLTVGDTYYVRIFQYGTSTTAGKTFDVKIWSPDTLSTETFENENAFTYFPNPVKNELQLNAQKDIQNVTVFNMLGQEVLRVTPNTVESTINMNELSQGAYFVKVTIDNVTETIRVLKQ